MNARTLASALALFVVGMSLPVSAQNSPVPAPPSNLPFVVGGQFSSLRLGGGLSDVSSSPGGFGGHLSYEMGRWVTLEGELDFFPNDKLTYGIPSDADFRMIHRRKRLEGFVGPKVTVLRMERFGVFGKVRPGFSRVMGQGVDCLGFRCAYINYITPTYQTDFALDVGAVLEFYPSSRTVARLDLGDTMVRQRSMAPPCRDCTMHNFSPRIGFGFRF